MRGLEKLINEMAQYECPCDYGLTDVKREKADNVMPYKPTVGCKYGDGKQLEICVECWQSSLILDYKEDGDNGRVKG